MIDLALFIGTIDFFTRITIQYSQEEWISEFLMSILFIRFTYLILLNINVLIHLVQLWREGLRIYIKIQFYCIFFQRCVFFCKISRKYIYTHRLDRLACYFVWSDRLLMLTLVSFDPQLCLLKSARASCILGYIKKLLNFTFVCLFETEPWSTYG